MRSKTSRPRHLHRTAWFLLASAALIALAYTWARPPANAQQAPKRDQRAMPAAAALPIPSRLSIEQGDRSAVLQWDLDPANPVFSLPAGVAGYRITWGPAGQPDANVKLTEEKVIQLQPLTNGQPYTARVQTVDSYGSLSQASAAVSFTGDPARVNRLRARMNSFFDDFNLPAGAPDELKWNAAYSRCNDPAANGFFINNQYHAHNMLFDKTCDRGHAISRPRAPLDFSDNLTRTIVFDFDGEFRRDQWYLDILPGFMDISGQVNVESGQGEANPGLGLRFRQNEQGVEIFWFTATGGEVRLATTDFHPYPPLDYAGLKLISNVQRHWEIQLSRTAAVVFVNGRRVLATQPNAFNLADNRYTVLWNTFSYNTDKANEPMVLVHWDNFGFDAPAGTAHDTVTHNYRVVNSGTDFMKAYGPYAPANTAITIPDSLAGAQAARLMFTLQMDGNDWYAWSANDRVAVNGVAFPIPRPTSNTTPPLDASGDLSRLVSTIRPYSVVIAVPPATFRTGKNTIAFTTAGSSVHNIHAEFDFKAASAPAYTPPAQVASGPPMPAMAEIGPAAVITRIGSVEVPTYADNLTNASSFSPRVAGLVPVSVEVHNDIAMHGNGSNPGIVLVQLLVDGQVALSQRTDTLAPAPAVRHTFNLDTRALARGQHEIFVRAYNPRCTPSIADYGGAGSQAGRYYPIHITVDNGRASLVEAAAAGGQRFYLPLITGAAPGSGGAACSPIATSQLHAGHDH